MRCWPILLLLLSTSEGLAQPCTGTHGILAIIAFGGNFQRSNDAEIGLRSVRAGQLARLTHQQTQLAIRALGPDEFLQQVSTHSWFYARDAFTRDLVSRIHRGGWDVIATPQDRRALIDEVLGKHPELSESERERLSIVLDRVLVSLHALEMGDRRFFSRSSETPDLNRYQLVLTQLLAKDFRIRLESPEQFLRATLTMYFSVSHSLLPLLDTGLLDPGPGLTNRLLLVTVLMRRIREGGALPSPSELITQAMLVGIPLTLSQADNLHSALRVAGKLLIRPLGEIVKQIRSFPLRTPQGEYKNKHYPLARGETRDEIQTRSGTMRLGIYLNGIGTLANENRVNPLEHAVVTRAIGDLGSVGQDPSLFVTSKPNGDILILKMSGNQIVRVTLLRGEGHFWVYERQNNEIGFDTGISTRWVQVEYHNGTIHGRPRKATGNESISTVLAGLRLEN